MYVNTLFEVLKILLEVGINIDAIDNDGNTVLHLACKRTGSMGEIKQFQFKLIFNEKTPSSVATFR